MNIRVLLAAMLADIESGAHTVETAFEHVAVQVESYFDPVKEAEAQTAADGTDMAEHGNPAA